VAYEYEIDEDVNCVFVRHFGEFGIDDVPNSFQDIVSDSRHRPGMNMLRAITETTQPGEYGFKFFKEKSQKRLGKFDQKLGKCRLAWFTTSGRDYRIIHQFITTRRFSHDLVERSPFTDLKSAKEWLGIPGDYEIELFAKAGLSEIGSPDDESKSIFPNS